MIGKTLAHYQITDLLGKGGMGEVYLAVDNRLDRKVAIKVLPQEVANDPALLQRFEREGRTVSSLNHPNICTLHDVGEQDGIRYLVMEHIEGETLADRLGRGPLPIAETLTIAAQIADALDKAHDKGVLHRDLKPGNIMLAAGGAKLLDFGLAKSGGLTGDPISSIALTQSSPLTADGSIVGTFQYMAPEQLEAKPVDARSDIFSFGAVLYEMVTGRPAFAASSQASLIVAIMSGEPPQPSAVTPSTPIALDRVVQRCLAKNADDRWRTAADLAAELRWIAEGGSSVEPAPEIALNRDGIGRERWAWFAAVAMLALVVAALVITRSSAPIQPLTQSTLMPPPDWDFAPGSPFAVGPDGRRVAFVANARREGSTKTKLGETSGDLWVRDLASSESHQLDGTDGAIYPFWSYDGRWLGFFANNKLNKIDARGGPVIALCDTRNGRGGTWNQDGTILFQAGWSEGLMKIPAGGGNPEPVTSLDKERFDVAHRWPRFLPDGNQFLFYLVSTTSARTSEHSGIYLGSLDSGETRLLLRSESRALYSQGHLLYRFGSTLMAQPFDPASAQLMGDPSPVSTDITGGAISWGGAQFGVSDTGVLVHLKGAGATNSLLTWYDREGNQTGTIGDENGYWEPRLSHGGKQLAVSIGQDTGDIWLHDLERDVRTRFTFDPADDRGPLWSPDDRRIVFSSSRASVGEIYERPTSGQEDAKLLYASGTNISLSHWSPDGRLVLFNSLALGDNAWDIWALDMETLEAKPVLDGNFNEMNGQLSPDGKWLAFNSDESGRFEVYVQAFPKPSGRWMVSTEGGFAQPAWRGDGREIFYMDSNDVVMAVDVETQPTPSFGNPRPLLVVQAKSSAAGVMYTVTQDGQRILANERPPLDPNKIGASLIQNWIAVLER